jgi:hypothetical protein
MKNKFLKSLILATGLFIGSTAFLQAYGQSETTPSLSSQQNAKYTCTVHSDVVQSQPGKCAKCGMTLVAQKDPNSSTYPTSRDTSSTKMKKDNTHMKSDSTNMNKTKTSPSMRDTSSTRPTM